MPVSSTHPDYDAALPSWQLMDDVLGGEESIKAAGDVYLPMFADQSTPEYQRFQTRADFFNATARTREALIGFLYRKDPEVQAPENDPMKLFQADATLTGKALYDLGKDIAEEVTGKGRYGTIIDWNEEEARPFVVTYCAQDILNWQYARIGGRMQLSLLSLFERDPEMIAEAIANPRPSTDRFMQALYPQWRVWELRGSMETGFYVACSVWRKRQFSPEDEAANRVALTGTGPAPGAHVQGPSEDYIQVADYIPKRRGIPLADIPWVWHTPKGPYPDMSRPPLEDLARQNLSLYRTNADFENALHALGTPTPCFFGFDMNADNIELGTSKAIVTNQAAAHAEYLSLKGGDITPLADREEAKMKKMAALGARMLDTQLSGGARAPEAFATVQLRQTGETAVLVKLSLALTQSMTDVLSWADWWVSRRDTPEDCESECQYILNTSFIEQTIDGPTATAFMQIYLQRGMSFESLFEKFQQGELIPENRSIEEERQLIQDGESLLMGPLQQQMQQAEIAATHAQTDALGKPSNTSDGEPPDKPKGKPGSDGGSGSKEDTSLKK